MIVAACCVAIAASPILYPRPFILGWNLTIDLLIWIIERAITALRMTGM
jgi:hypothetical protein